MFSRRLALLSLKSDHRLSCSPCLLKVVIPHNVQTISKPIVAFGTSNARFLLIKPNQAQAITSNIAQDKTSPKSLQGITAQSYLPETNLKTTSNRISSEVQRQSFSSRTHPKAVAHGMAGEIDEHLQTMPTQVSKTTNPVSEKPRPFHTMPGPGGLYRLPYVGAMLLFAPFSKYTPENFGQLILEMHQRYGPIFRTRLGMQYTVHTANLEDFQKVYEADGQYPERRYMNLSRIYRLRNNLPQALGTVNGPDWQALRSPLNKLVNRPQSVLNFLNTQNAVAADFVKLIEARGNKMNAKEQSELFFNYSAESIGVICFNDRLGFLSPDLRDNTEQQKLLDAFKTCILCTFKDIIGAERKYVLTKNDAFYKKYADAMEYIRHRSTQYTQKIIKSMEIKNGFHDSNLTADLITQSNLSLEQILAIIDSLLIAGTDSTARTLSVLLYNLARNPDVQAKAAEEIDNVLGQDDNVTSANLTELRYTKACVKESMRLNSPISPGPQRNLTRDVTLSGYHVPKGTGVIMASCLTSCDPQLFSNPLSFQPERWLRSKPNTSSNQPTKDRSTEEIFINRSTTSKEPVAEEQGSQRACPVSHNARTLSFAVLPFGHGTRSCIGRKFAELELYVGLARVLQKFEVKVMDGYGVLDVHYTPFITPKEPIPFVFKPRHQSRK